jgi:hypothetical protein
MAMEHTHGRARSAAELTDDEVAHLNPLQPGYGAMTRNPERIDHLASRAVEPAEYLFNDDGLWTFAKRNMDLSREAFRHKIREEAFRATTLHELGHNMGLRHNFIASFDRTNYFPEYWTIKKQVEQELGPEPEFEPFKSGEETEEAFLERYQAWSDLQETRRAREVELGLREYRYASIMDYSGLLYNDWLGLGSYDKAAMRFVYADLVDATDCEGDIERCATAPRKQTTWYLGGELCEADGDCPASSMGQKCRRDNRATGDLGVSICSNWDDDQRAQGKFNPRQQFCTDDRVNDQPFCNRFDEGESSEEIVRNMIELYERNFVFNNFRRYRKSFSTWGYYNRIMDRYFLQIGDQMQALLYKYFYEPGFRSNTGPGGFYDMFRATVIGFDFLGNVLAQPESGSYRWNEDTQLYEQLSPELVENPDDETINIPLGLGKTLYSSYEDGIIGEVKRLSYVGTFYDKKAALYVLTARDFGQSSLPNDERFYLSFHDFFPRAFSRLIGSFMSGEFAESGLVFDSEAGTLQQRTFWDGTFFGGDDGFDPENMELPGGEVEPRPISTQQIENLLLRRPVCAVVRGPLVRPRSSASFELGGETGFDIDGAPGIEAVPANRLSIYQSPLTHRTFVAVGDRRGRCHLVPGRRARQCAPRPDADPDRRRGPLRVSSTTRNATSARRKTSSGRWSGSSTSSASARSDRTTTPKTGVQRRKKGPRRAPFHFSEPDETGIARACAVALTAPPQRDPRGARRRRAGSPA